MPVYLFKRPRPDMDAGKLEESVKAELGIAPIKGKIYCEEASGIFHFDAEGKKTFIGPSSIKVDSDLGDLQPVADFSFGNGVTVDAVRTKENRWVPAIWLVFASESKSLIDTKYDQLRTIILSHTYQFPEPKSSGPNKHKAKHENRWWQIKNSQDQNDQLPRTDMFFGKRGEKKHAHLILKGEQVITGTSPRDVLPETLVSQLKAIGVSNQGIIEYEYCKQNQSSARRLESRAWPATTTSNTLVDKGYMSITITPLSATSKFVVGLSGMRVDVRPD
jgi:hypothetical protein